MEKQDQDSLERATVQEQNKPETTIVSLSRKEYSVPTESADMNDAKGQTIGVR